MKYFIAISFLTFTLMGCSFSARTKENPTQIREPQYARPAISDTEAGNETELHLSKVFSTLINYESDSERSQATAHFLDRQRNFFYIAQGLLSTFDEELSRLHRKHVEQGIPLTPKDMENFERI